MAMPTTADVDSAADRSTITSPGRSPLPPTNNDHHARLHNEPDSPDTDTAENAELGSARRTLTVPTKGARRRQTATEKVIVANSAAWLRRRAPGCRIGGRSPAGAVFALADSNL